MLYFTSKKRILHQLTFWFDRNALVGHFLLLNDILLIMKSSVFA